MQFMASQAEISASSHVWGFNRKGFVRHALDISYAGPLEPPQVWSEIDGSELTSRLLEPSPTCTV
jgi:hypothetical protein